MRFINTCLIVFFIFFCCGCMNDSGEAKEIKISAPDFKTFTDAKQKKQAFIAYLYPLIAYANKEVLMELDEIKNIAARKLAHDETLIKLQEKCKKYKVDCSEALVNEIILLLSDKIDIVPPSLALAQAANESAWGTSRFARDANNYFGQWCFSEGCGLVPKLRAGHAKHEVRVFESVLDSVRSYVHNLNTSHAYEQFRSERRKLREHALQVVGVKLVKGLSSYSERGEDYVEEIKTLIRQNKLHTYDENFMLLVENDL